MPYDASHPPSVFGKYSSKCQRAAVHAFNSVHGKTGDEGKAMAAGHAAAKQCQGANKSMDKLSLPLTTFKVYVPDLIASRDPNTGDMRIEGTASSTIVDHHGDQITEKALRKMAKNAVGMTIWLNHLYKIPADVFGKVEKARVVKTHETDPKTGKEIYDLKFGIKVSKKSDDAVRAFEQMEEDGIRLGLSIGAMVPEGGAAFEKADGSGRYIVDDLELVETSLIGIPANPRSWVDYAVKAFAGVYATNGETGEENERFITKKLELLKELDEGPGTEDMVNDEAPAEAPEAPEEVAAAPEPSTDEADQAATEVSNSLTFTTVDGETTSGTITADNITVGEDGPEVILPSKTRVSIWDGDKTIEIDTGRSKPKDGDQSAQETDNAGGTGTSGGTTKSAALTINVDPSQMESVKDLIKGLTMQVEASKAENEDLRKERDAALELGQKLLEGTREILDKVGSIPVGRKTLAGVEEGQLQKADHDLERVAHIYDAEVRAILKRSSHANGRRTSA